MSKTKKTKLLILIIFYNFSRLVAEAGAAKIVRLRSKHNKKYTKKKKTGDRKKQHAKFIMFYLGWLTGFYVGSTVSDWV